MHGIASVHSHVERNFACGKINSGRCCASPAMLNSVMRISQPVETGGTQMPASTSLKLRDLKYNTAVYLPMQRDLQTCASRDSYLRGYARVARVTRDSDFSRCKLGINFSLRQVSTKTSKYGPPKNFFELTVLAK